MNKPTIAIGNDHAGTELKQHLIERFSDRFNFTNYGTDANDSVDYPDHVHPVCKDIVAGRASFGILICGSANGVCMTANKYPAIRAGLAWNKEVAALIKQHNNANVICLPARFLTIPEAIAVFETYLNETFEGGRHQRRVDKIPC